MAKKARANPIEGKGISGLNNILQLAVQVGLELEKCGILFCFIGGTAYQRWGEPRQTSDVDATLMVEFGSRPQDWIDVEKVIIRQGARLNRVLIKDELLPLAELKEEPEIMDRLAVLFQKHAV